MSTKYMMSTFRLKIQKRSSLRVKIIKEGYTEEVELDLDCKKGKGF